MYEGNLNHYGEDLISVNSCEQVNIMGNTLSATAGSALVLDHVRDASIQANSLRGLEGECRGAGLHLSHADRTIIQGNLMSGFNDGVRLDRANRSTMSHNILDGVQTALSVARSEYVSISDNHLEAKQVGIDLKDLTNFGLGENRIEAPCPIRSQTPTESPIVESENLLNSN